VCLLSLALILALKIGFGLSAEKAERKKTEPARSQPQSQFESHLGPVRWPLGLVFTRISPKCGAEKATEFYTIKPASKWILRLLLLQAQ